MENEMLTFIANCLTVPDDVLLDYGEGVLSFRWTDHLGVKEGLDIELDGFCSRAMPIRCGMGPPRFTCVERDRVRIQFGPELASQIHLDEEIEIHFTLDDQQFLDLQRTIKIIERRFDEL